MIIVIQIKLVIKQKDYIKKLKILLVLIIEKKEN